MSKGEELQNFTIRLPADVIETIRELGLTPKLRQLITAHTEGAKMTQETEEMSVDEMAKNLEVCGGEVADFDLDTFCKDAVDEACSDRDSCKRYDHLNLVVAIVTVPNSVMRFHGFAKTGAFIYFSQCDGYSAADEAVVYFKKHEDAATAFANELWIGDDEGEEE